MVESDDESNPSTAPSSSPAPVAIKLTGKSTEQEGFVDVKLDQSPEIRAAAMAASEDLVAKIDDKEEGGEEFVLDLNGDLEPKRDMKAVFKSRVAPLLIPSDDTSHEVNLRVVVPVRQTEESSIPEPGSDPSMLREKRVRKDSILSLAGESLLVSPSAPATRRRTGYGSSSRSPTDSMIDSLIESSVEHFFCSTDSSTSNLTDSNFMLDFLGTQTMPDADEGNIRGNNDSREDLAESEAVPRGREADSLQFKEDDEILTAEPVDVPGPAVVIPDSLAGNQGAAFNADLAEESKDSPSTLRDRVQVPEPVMVAAPALNPGDYDELSPSPILAAIYEPPAMAAMDEGAKVKGNDFEYMNSRLTQMLAAIQAEEDNSQTSSTPKNESLVEVFPSETQNGPQFIFNTNTSHLSASRERNLRLLASDISLIIANELLFPSTDSENNRVGHGFLEPDRTETEADQVLEAAAEAAAVAKKSNSDPETQAQALNRLLEAIEANEPISSLENGDSGTDRTVSRAELVGMTALLSVLQAEFLQDMNLSIEERIMMIEDATVPFLEASSSRSSLWRAHALNNSISIAIAAAQVRNATEIDQYLVSEADPSVAQPHGVISATTMDSSRVTAGNELQEMKVHINPLAGGSHGSKEAEEFTFHGSHGRELEYVVERRGSLKESPDRVSLWLGGGEALDQYSNSPSRNSLRNSRKSRSEIDPIVVETADGGSRVTSESDNLVLSVSDAASPLSETVTSRVGLIVRALSKGVSTKVDMASAVRKGGFTCCLRPRVLND